MKNLHPIKTLDDFIAGLDWILEGDRFGFGANWDPPYEPEDEEEEAGRILWNLRKFLQAQVPVRPARTIDNGIREICGACGKTIFAQDNYCSCCGRKVLR